jgi:hypothetical protein
MTPKVARDGRVNLMALEINQKGVVQNEKASTWEALNMKIGIITRY